MMNTLLLYYQRTTEIDDKMLWKKSAINQMIFMRDTIGNLLRTGIFVIGKHRSKSIDLPVYGFVMRNGVKVIASYNFYCWVVSLELPGSFSLPTNLFSDWVEKEVSFCYGFKKEWEYGCYTPESLKFTVELIDSHRVFTLLFLLKNAFPDKIFTNNRGPQEIASSIDEIFTTNGFYSLRDVSEDLGLKKPCLKPIMSGWEIMCNTYSKLKNIGDEDYMTISKDPKVYAEYIYKYPEVFQEFLIEENAFKTIF